MNISNFLSWFIQQFINIGTTTLAYLDQITIYGEITLMEFIITITIIGAFIGIVITAPNLNTIGRVTTREKKNKGGPHEVNTIKEYEDNMWRYGM